MKRKKGNGKYHKWITEEGLLEIEGWARDGLVDKQIAHNIGITEQTLNNWKQKYPSLFESLKRGKEVVDRQVENALLKRALGYTYQEKTYERFENTVVAPNGDIYKEPGTKIKTVVKEVAPDVTAQIFWLKNRKPIEWRDKKDVNLTTDKSLEDFFGDE